MDELGDDAPPQRKRVSKACDRCRRRKDKCDGKKPTCGTCEQGSAVCSWNPLSKKRGLPDGYVRGLEKLCGAVIREVPGVQDLLLSKFSADEDTLYDYWADDGNSNSTIELWKKSRIVKELDRFLPVLDGLTKKGKKRTWEESEGLAAGQNIAPTPRLVPSPPVSTIKEDEDIVAAPPLAEVVEPLATDMKRSDSLGHPVSSSNDWAQPASAGRLVETYFSYTHIWFPLVERHDLLRVLYQGSKSKVTRSPGENAVLWAVITYAQAFYTIISPTDEDHNSDIDEFYGRAKSLITVVDGEYELGHVQAILILSLLKIGQQDWKSAWLLVGHAVRIAVNLGLDLIPQNVEQSRLPERERRRKHVFLGCFVLDTIVAARLGRNPYLRSHDAERVGMLDEDGLEEWDHWNDVLGITRSTSASPLQATTLSTFNNLVHLVQILNDIICFSPSRKPSPEEDVDHRHNGGSANVYSSESSVFYHEIMSRLDSWKASHESIEESSVPSQCDIYLAYLSVIMALNLRFPSSMALIYLGYNTIQWLRRYEERLGLLVLPPWYEYSLKLAGDCITHSINASGSDNFKDINWIGTWQQVAAALSRAWPVFQLSASLPQSNSMTSVMPRMLKMSSHGQARSTSTTAPSLSQSNSDYWQTSQAATPRVLIETTPHSSHSPSTQHQPPPQVRPVGMEASLDQDSIFNEFDAMDANLWSNTWEQSLLNLGFTTDIQNVDEEFYSFFGYDGLKPSDQTLGVASSSDPIPGAQFDTTK